MLVSCLKRAQRTGYICLKWFHRLLFGQLNLIPVIVLMSSLGSSCQSQRQGPPARFISDKTHKETFQTVEHPRQFEHPYVGDRDQTVCHYMDLNHTPYCKFYPVDKEDRKQKLYKDRI